MVRVRADQHRHLPRARQLVGAPCDELLGDVRMRASRPGAAQHVLRLPLPPRRAQPARVGDRGRGQRRVRLERLLGQAPATPSGPARAPPRPPPARPCSPARPAAAPRAIGRSAAPCGAARRAARRRRDGPSRPRPPARSPRSQSCFCTASRSSPRKPSSLRVRPLRQLLVERGRPPPRAPPACPPARPAAASAGCRPAAAGCAPPRAAPRRRHSPPARSAPG